MNTIILIAIFFCWSGFMLFILLLAGQEGYALLTQQRMDYSFMKRTNKKGNREFSS